MHGKRCIYAGHASSMGIAKRQDASAGDKAERVLGKTAALNFFINGNSF